MVETRPTSCFCLTNDAIVLQVAKTKSCPFEKVALLILPMCLVFTSRHFLQDYGDIFLD